MFCLLFVREPGQPAPPTWPAKILQKIARYVFETENKETSLLIQCSKLTIFSICQRECWSNREVEIYKFS